MNIFCQLALLAFFLLALLAFNINLNVLNAYCNNVHLHILYTIIIIIRFLYLKILYYFTYSIIILKDIKDFRVLCIIYKHI